MDFVLGTFIGALGMALAVAVSITYEPFGMIREYRLELGLEDEDDGDGNEELS